MQMQKLAGPLVRALTASLMIPATATRGAAQGHDSSRLPVFLSGAEQAALLRRQLQVRRFRARQFA